MQETNATLIACFDDMFKVDLDVVNLFQET